ncbi:hypothetical protein BDV96DRAFT_670714 [Lophiotrema nucula]|uniref:Uncharacterized protein n=1 Tax=Lophiotrema nucula TaxID=690887 RepID=A0A6A5YNJ1_9PLEO|nr:hypothetical protein BDV96DRAFT_670714 [Lophiotrema nucula]
MASCPAETLARCASTPRPVEANPDIAGIGVIVSFFSTTCLAVFLATVILFLDRLSTLVDRARSVRRFNLRHLERKSFWISGLSKILLGLNDSQLFTGTAVQIVAIIQHCTISVYHFRIVTELAFLSTVTHLITLLVLEGYFIKDKKSNIPRVLVMLINLALLGYTSWNGYAFEMSSSTAVKSSLIACFSGARRPRLGPAFYARWTILLLLSILGHCSVFMQMYIPRDVCQGRPGLARISYWLRDCRLFTLMPAYTIYGLVNGGRVLWRTQALRKADVPITGSEQDWGFGQILAMLLLGLTLLPGWEVFSQYEFLNFRVLKMLTLLRLQEEIREIHGLRPREQNPPMESIDELRDQS